MSRGCRGGCPTRAVRLPSPRRWRHRLNATGTAALLAILLCGCASHRQGRAEPATGADAERPRRASCCGSPRWKRAVLRPPRSSGSCASAPSTSAPAPRGAPFPSVPAPAAAPARASRCAPCCAASPAGTPTPRSARCCSSASDRASPRRSSSTTRPAADPTAPRRCWWCSRISSAPGARSAAQLVEILEKQAAPHLRVCFKHLPAQDARARPARRAGGRGRAAPGALLADARSALHPPARARAPASSSITPRRSAWTSSASSKTSTPTRWRRGCGGTPTEAVRLRIRGTPTFLINGREMTDPKTVPDFLDWIAEAVALKRRAP